MAEYSQKPRLTVIQHDVRERLGLTILEYCVADAIYHFSHGKGVSGGGANIEWVKNSLPELVGVPLKVINSIIDRLSNLGLVTKKSSKNSVYTTDRYFALVIAQETSFAHTQSLTKNKNQFVNQTNVCVAPNFPEEKGVGEGFAHMPIEKSDAFARTRIVLYILYIYINNIYLRSLREIKFSEEEKKVKEHKEKKRKKKENKEKQEKKKGWKNLSPPSPSLAGKKSPVTQCPGKGGKRRYGDFVLLTDAQHAALLDNMSVYHRNKLVADLDAYIGSRGKRYKSHYHTILVWYRRARAEGKLKDEQTELVEELARIGNTAFCKKYGVATWEKLPIK